MRSCTHCPVQVFTFLTMDSPVENIAVKPIGDVAKVENSLTSFRGEKAQCFKKEDREQMLAIIEAAFGDFATFNKLVCSVFVQGRSAAPRGRRATASVSPQ